MYSCRPGSPPCISSLHANLLVVILHVEIYKTGGVNQGKFFRALGQRVRRLREKSGYSQEDMISFGFSARHWQQIEAGRPITATTLAFGPGYADNGRRRCSITDRRRDKRGIYSIVWARYGLIEISEHRRNTPVSRRDSHNIKPVGRLCNFSVDVFSQVEGIDIHSSVTFAGIRILRIRLAPNPKSEWRACQRRCFVEYACPAEYDLFRRLARDNVGNV